MSTVLKNDYFYLKKFNIHFSLAFEKDLRRHYKDMFFKQLESHKMFLYITSDGRLSMREASLYMGVSKKHVLHLVNTHQIRAVRYKGCGPFVYVHHLKEYMEKNLDRLGVGNNNKKRLNRKKK